MNKKFLAKLLIFCMVFTMLPMAAFAAESTEVGDVTYSIAFDTNSATAVVAGGSATVKANVYANGNDAKGIAVAYEVAPAVDGVTVNNGVVTVASTVDPKTEIKIKATATVAENKTIEATKTLTVTEAAPVAVNGGDISGALINNITTDNTKLVYAVGNDTVVITTTTGNVTIASETVNSILTSKYTTVIVRTPVADIYLTEAVARAIQAAYEGAAGTTVTLNVTNSTVTGAVAAYNVTFTVGGNPVMAEANGNLYLQLKVAKPEGITNTVYAYYVTAGEMDEKAPVYATVDGEFVVLRPQHFSTIALTAEKLDGATDPVNPGYQGGGGGGSSSNVSIATKVTGGKVTVTPTRPTRGQTVTINVTPNEGYKLDTLVVTDNKGNNVELTKVSDNKYTFVMPAGKVTVTPTFVKTDAKEETKDPSAVKRFSDVASGAWYAEYITYVTENALMNGYDDGRFGPNDQTTRAQIVTVLYRLEGEPATRSSNSFSDVSSGGQYYSSAVAWAAINDIVNGYEDGRFGPNDNVTREQIATILYRYATYKGYDTENAGSIANFSDAAKVSSWANTAISWAVGEELMNGDNGALRPQGNATRAEIAALLMRFCENIAK